MYYVTFASTFHSNFVINHHVNFVEPNVATCILLVNCFEFELHCYICVSCFVMCRPMFESEVIVDNRDKLIRYLS